MQKQKGAASRRKVGFAAAIVLAGGLAGSALLSGTAMANPTYATTTSFSIGSWYTLSPGVAGDVVDVSVSSGTGNPAPTGSAVVSFGTTECTVTLTTPSSGDTSTGACFYDGSHAPGIPFGTYTVNVTYNPTGAFEGSSASQGGVTVGTVNNAPSFTSDSPPLSASVGEDYDYTFVATGTPAPSYSLAWGAPWWLHINSSTGEVSGTVPWGTTSFSYAVKASNSVGSVTAGPYTVWVNGNGGGHHHGHSNLATSLSCPSWVSNFGSGKCTLTVTNDGSASASNVFAQIVLPSQLDARYCSPGGFWWWGSGWQWGGGCSISDNTANLQIGTLGAGDSKTLSVTFRVGANQFFGWWHAEKVTVEGIAGSNGSFWFGKNGESISYASIRIWPSRHWW